MKVSIVSQSNRPITEVEIPDQATYDDLRKAYNQKKKTDIFRQQFYLQTADKKRGEALKYGSIADKVHTVYAF